MQHSVATDLQSPNHGSARDWVTAKVIESGRARQYVNRLDVLGFDYKVVQQDRELRILVRRQMLEEVLGWIDDLSNRQTAPTSRNANHGGVYLLFAIPLGVLAGALVSFLLGIPSPASYAIAGYSGLAAIALSFVIGSQFAKR